MLEWRCDSDLCPTEAGRFTDEYDVTMVLLRLPEQWDKITLSIGADDSQPVYLNYMCECGMEPRLYERQCAEEQDWLS